MGAAAVVGDVFTCCRKHHEINAVKGVMSSNVDLNDAVLAAVNKSIEHGQVGLTNTVRLSFQGLNLPNLDTFTRSDGMAVLFQKQNRQWQRIGQTEVI